jgi:hypothetical protein
MGRNRFVILLLILLCCVFETSVGGRYFDGGMGRFLAVDPKSHKSLAWSAYGYAGGNPLKYIDPDGQEVRAFTEKLGSRAGGGGIKGIIVALSQARHSYLRVTTDKIDVILELGGPRFIPNKGNPIAKDAQYEVGRRPDQQEHKVERPAGVSAGDFSFEKKIIEIFQVIEQNLPDYDAIDGPNSNGFVTFLVEAAGGSVRLPDEAIGKDEINEYYQKYVEFLRFREEEKKKEERKKQ